MEVENIEPGKDYTVLALIELIVYELFSFMMLWSHLATMCTDPGFIPFHYRYDQDRLTKPFQVITDGDMTGKELKQASLGVVDIERRDERERTGT